jgi:tetratricopeptide (TPR) repeat protein
MKRRSGIAVLWAVTTVAALVLGSAEVRAAGGGGGGGVLRVDQNALHEQPDYVAGVAAIGEQRWADAIKALERHVGRNYRDADAQNWLAYANRKAGNLDEAFKHYKLALTFDPRHLGAHEYIGEAYLMAGQIDEARKHLEQLATLCGRQCEQYRDLAEAIEQKRVSSAR